MLSFLTTVSVLYLFYYTAMIGHDLIKNKDKPSGSPVSAVHIDFTVKYEPKNVAADLPAAVNDTNGEGKKNQQDEQAEKESHQVQDIREGLMDAEELQNFLNDLNIEFVKPDFSLAKPVNYENIEEDAQPVA